MKKLLKSDSEYFTIACSVIGHEEICEYGVSTTRTDRIDIRIETEYLLNCDYIIGKKNVSDAIKQVVKKILMKTGLKTYALFEMHDDENEFVYAYKAHPMLGEIEVSQFDDDGEWSWRKEYQDQSAYVDDGSIDELIDTMSELIAFIMFDVIQEEYFEIQWD